MARRVSRPSARFGRVMAAIVQHERSCYYYDTRPPWSAQNRGTVMPFVNVKVIEGVFSSEQKQEMVRRLTDTMVSIEGENMRPVTWVVVEEVQSGDWGIGGNPLSTADVQALAAGQPVG
jgi:4-oxalocrotonate tautomerase